MVIAESKPSRKPAPFCSPFTKSMSEIAILRRPAQRDDKPT
jgi:hypothetical protein